MDKEVSIVTPVGRYARSAPRRLVGTVSVGACRIPTEARLDGGSEQHGCALCDGQDADRQEVRIPEAVSTGGNVQQEPDGLRALSESRTYGCPSGAILLTARTEARDWP